MSQFEPIKRNKYLERKRIAFSTKDCYQNACNCKKFDPKFYSEKEFKAANCGLNCLNKCVAVECYLGSCPAKQFCQNRRFQQHMNAHVYPFKTHYKGWGLAAGRFIAKGTFIMQYVGEVFSIDSEIG